MRMPKLLIMKAFTGNDARPTAAARQMVGLAEKARREGLLALEDELADVDDPFTRKGVQLVVDGTDSDLVRDILESRDRRHGGAPQPRAPSSSATAGGFAPTLGIIGTVLSLVHVLENLSEPGRARPLDRRRVHRHALRRRRRQPRLPADRQQAQGALGDELLYREMLIEAILSIQAGDNPRMLAEKLETFLAPERPRRGRQAKRRPRPPTARRSRRRHELARPQEPPAAAAGDHGGGHEGARRALAAHLRRHDHAADGAVHRHVGDLVGEHSRSSRSSRSR